MSNKSIYLTNIDIGFFPHHFRNKMQWMRKWWIAFKHVQKVAVCLHTHRRRCYFWALRKVFEIWNSFWEYEEMKTQIEIEKKNWTRSTSTRKKIPPFDYSLKCSFLGQNTRQASQRNTSFADATSVVRESLIIC